MRPCIVILGPTAAGKSDLAVSLAKRFSGTIISADSRQVYRRLNIGSGKITTREMRGIQHELLDVATPRGQYSISRYYHHVQHALKAIPMSSPIFLVGGSPYYIRAVTEPGSYSTVPPNPGLRKKLARRSLPELIRWLRRLDPPRLKTIDRNNRRRLERAIEIAQAHIPRGGILETVPLFAPVLKIGITFPRAELYRRIDQRVDRRLKQGMIVEVARLHRDGVSWKRLDAFGLEYRYISRHLRGQLTKVEMTIALKGAIHDFARRQLTWWRKDSDIHWVKNERNATRIIKNFLA